MFFVCVYQTISFLEQNSSYYKSIYYLLLSMNNILGILFLTNKYSFTTLLYGCNTTVYSVSPQVLDL